MSPKKNWRERIYQEIFEEKSLPKALWKIINQINVEDKNLPKKIWRERIYQEFNLEIKKKRRLLFFLCFFLIFLIIDLYQVQIWRPPFFYFFEFFL